MPVRIRPAVRGDLVAVLGLLREAGLPVDGVPEHAGRFVVAEDRGHVVGCAGLEIYPADRTAALLRSVAVRPDFRGRGLGLRLTREILKRARASGVREVALLTTTARHFFARFGFQVVPRDAVNRALHASAEFQGACCPDTAVAMCLQITGPLKAQTGASSGAANPTAHRARGTGDISGSRKRRDVRASGGRVDG